MAEEISAVMFTGAVKNAGFAGQARVIGVEKFEFDGFANPELCPRVEAKTADTHVCASRVAGHRLVADAKDAHRRSYARSLVAPTFGRDPLDWRNRAWLGGDTHPE